METINFLSEYQILENTQDYAEAAVTSNPLIKWVKFVFTDNKANANNQVIPTEEFPNIIKTGANMPIKMEQATLTGNHELSSPIGVITNLVKQDNKVIGLAALWKKERPDDVDMLEKAYAEGKPLGLSWEVFFEKSEVDDNGIEKLQGTIVRAITFVGNPAYAGRTNVFEMAEAKSENQEEGKLTDNTKPAEVVELETANSELSNQITSLQAQLSTSSEEVASLKSELEELRQYKNDREANDARSALIATRRNALAEAGINLTDEDFNTRVDRLVSMDDETFGFYVQDLVAFSGKKESSSSVRNSEIPDLTVADKISNPVEILRAGLKSN